MKEYNNMVEHCFIDSNIWLYAFVESQDNNKLVLARATITNNVKAITVSSQIINEVCVNLIKKANFSNEKIRKLIHNFYNKYNVIDLSQEVLIKASIVRDNHCFSFWDSLVVASALIADCEILFSEDMQDNYLIENTRIINPLL